jgi:endonuclease/exonuclease/phosphatase family metal-dependent hydrolase
VGTRFRVLTANLWRGRGAHPDGLARLVEDLQPDVVAVQELGWPQAAALAGVLPFGRLDPGRENGEMGIARRSPGPVSRIPLAYRDAYATELSLAAAGGGSVAVEIISVHIVGPHLQPTWWALATRRAQLRGLEAHLAAAPDRPRVIVGDFNSTPLWPLYRRLAGGVRDAAREAAAGNGGRPARTWGPWSGSPRLLRIDHALVSRLAVHALRAVRVPGSDHSALVVDLSLPHPGSVVAEA